MAATVVEKAPVASRALWAFAVAASWVAWEEFFMDGGRLIEHASGARGTEGGRV